MLSKKDSVDTTSLLAVNIAVDVFSELMQEAVHLDARVKYHTYLFNIHSLIYTV